MVALWRGAAGGRGRRPAAGGEERDDVLWSAVGDRVRRQVLVLLREGRGTATPISHRLPLTRQGVAKHLDVLDRAGLVHASVSGRERFYEIDHDQLSRAVAQLTSVGEAWDSRLQRIKRIAEQIERAGRHRHRSAVHVRRGTRDGVSPARPHRACP